MAAFTKSALEMATGTVPRRGLVHYDPTALDIARSRVAILAEHVHVRALEREVGLLLVVKDGRLPLLRVMAHAAILRFTGLDELSGVRVRMTCGASCRRRFEGCLRQLVLRSHGLVALLALDLRVATEQRKFRL